MDNINYIKKEFFEQFIPDLIFMTISGIEVRKDSRFIGPHVGSYYTKLFSRTLFETNLPTILFIDDNKILPNTDKSSFNIGKCYPVFDSKLTWDGYCRKNPFAICAIARSEENRNYIVEYFSQFGFSSFGSEDKEFENYPIFMRSKNFNAF
jgi:hypothetical protein